MRQVERLYRVFKAGGPSALVSRKRGRPSPRRLPETRWETVLKLVRGRYSDFGPTLALEKLRELHGTRLSRETLRQWMVGAGLWVPRAQRRQRPHPPRYRRPCLGELVQIDGCDHEWFEDRRPRCVLLVFVDDATSRIMHLRFVASESTFDYFAAVRRYIERHGKPVAFYSDKASIFRVNARAPRCGPNATQFARAMGELNIDVLCANSPQAKGRVERTHQTLQDRLVKELRLRGIDNPDHANGFAPEFMADYNRRFGREPADARDAHRTLRSDEDLDEILRWKEHRTLTHNLTVHYRRHLYVVDDSPAARAARGKVVEVHELEDGTVTIRHRAAVLSARVFRKDGAVRQQDVADNKYLASTLERVRQAQIANDVRQLQDGKLTKRQKVTLRASLAQRASADELAAVATQPPPTPPLRPAHATSPATPNRYLASVLERIEQSGWKEHIERATPPRRRSRTS
ncbi:MAG: ISNCY family transposase [Myxococcota bacterium]|nr:ISNCY family transposase [Myxococcota bacterium]